jgi:hypothetical protein
MAHSSGAIVKLRLGETVGEARGILGEGSSESAKIKGLDLECKVEPNIWEGDKEERDKEKKSQICIQSR